MKDNIVKDLINNVSERTNATDYASTHCLITTLVNQNTMSCRGCKFRTLYGCVIVRVGKGLL